MLITPATEVDGWDRQVDLVAWKHENPNRAAPGLLYWGRYVAHDNNRDGMSLALNCREVDEDVSGLASHGAARSARVGAVSLYVNGKGPYNAWVDPIVVNEWQKLAYEEVEQMTKRGVPGVWTHGFYDGWAPNYMFYGERSQLDRPIL